jgi:hypothetical protein
MSNHELEKPVDNTLLEYRYSETLTSIDVTIFKISTLKPNPFIMSQ